MYFLFRCQVLHNPWHLFVIYSIISLSRLSIYEGENMIYRVKQFFRGLTAYEYDTALVDKYLNQEEKELFSRLPPYEARHAIDTANTIKNFEVKQEKEILIKAALLHDIGKIDSGIGLIKKSVLVLMDRFFPSISRCLSKSNFMFNVYYNHPEMGAVLLEKIDTEEKVIKLVRYHHSKKNVDITNIGLLMKADNLN